jgi:hypothetical protein
VIDGAGGRCTAAPWTPPGRWKVLRDVGVLAALPANRPAVGANLCRAVLADDARAMLVLSAGRRRARGRHGTVRTARVRADRADADLVHAEPRMLAAGVVGVLLVLPAEIRTGRPLPCADSGVPRLPVLVRVLTARRRPPAPRGPALRTSSTSMGMLRAAGSVPLPLKGSRGSALSCRCCLRARKGAARGRRGAAASRAARQHGLRGAREHARARRGRAEAHGRVHELAGTRVSLHAGSSVSFVSSASSASSMGSTSSVSLQG